MNGAKIEAMAEKEWALMTDEEKAEYDNDYDFFVSDLMFCIGTDTD